ncbi:MAG TPA: ABC transporter substrate-binding protein [bacterium]|nr:ABC transporter substrate-binding protein [bacterium]
MKRREMLRTVGGAAVSLLGWAYAGAAQEKAVKLGALFDLTGPTGDIGAHYGDGFRDYVRWVNEHGGIRNGMKIDLEWADYQYKPDQAVAFLKKAVEQDQVVALSGWGTGDSILMKQQIEDYGVPYVPASFHDGLLTPPNDWIWLIGPSYTDHMKTLLDYIKRTHTGIGKPRVALAVHNSPYGRSPVGPAKQYGPTIGVEIMDVEEVPSNVLDATSQILTMKQFAPTHIVIQNVARPAAITVRDARKLGVNAQVLGIHYIGDQLLFDLAGDGADGVIASTFVSNWFENVPGMAEVHQVNAAYHPDVSVRPLHYTQGVVHAKVWIEVLKQADTLTRAGIRKVFERFRLTTGGLTAPITYGPNDRKGADGIKLLRADVKTRQFTPITDWLTPPE